MAMNDIVEIQQTLRGVFFPHFTRIQSRLSNRGVITMLPVLEVLLAAQSKAGHLFIPARGPYHQGTSKPLLADHRQTGMAGAVGYRARAHRESSMAGLWTARNFPHVKKASWKGNKKLPIIDRCERTKVRGGVQGAAYLSTGAHQDSEFNGYFKNSVRGWHSIPLNRGGVLLKNLGSDVS